MNEKAKTTKTSHLPIIIIIAAFIAVVSITMTKKQSASEFVDDSGNIIVSNTNSYANWFGKEVPDFTITDIEGNEHRISDYRGKNLIIVFWATWCYPCKVEVPHLIELRKQESEDDLALIAITNDKIDTVRNFVNTKGINYTVASLGNTYLPGPFANVNAIPTSFFIDPDGKIKSVVVQSLNLEQIKAILNAKLIK